MLTKRKKRTNKNFQIVYSNNKPVSIILDIEEYREMVERLEDIEDIDYIRSLKKDKLEFSSFDDFLEDMA